MGDLVRNANVPLSLYRSYDSGDLTEVPPEFTEPKRLARPLEEDEATNQSGRVVRRYDIYLVSLLRGGLLLAEFLERGGAGCQSLIKTPMAASAIEGGRTPVGRDQNHANRASVRY